MNTLQTLKAGRAKITLAANFTQGWLARNSMGRPVEAYSPSACKWCSEGAIISVAPLIPISDLQGVYGALKEEMKGCIWLFNDNHTHAEVLAAWDTAIEKEEAK